jgi:hypothetical protein
VSHLETEKLKAKAKLLQKSKRRAGVSIRLKDAFRILARAAGFSTWRDLRDAVDATGGFCPPGGSAFGKNWFASYAEARAFREANGGFLLPYRKQFFVCGEEYVNFLGIPAGDPDLARVGPNWAEPADLAAWKRLLRRIERSRRKP